LLRSLVGDELGDLPEPARLSGPLDDRQGPRERAGRVGDGDAGARAAVVQREDLRQESASTISLWASPSASGSLSGSLPPARAIVGRPPPPPPTSAAALRTTSEALMRSATESSKFATR